MRAVHTYMNLVQCPRCRHTFMRLGDECCWRCAPVEPAPTGAQLAAARLVRQEAEAADGSLGSLAGLGFAPLGPPPVIFGAPRVSDVPGSRLLTPPRPRRIDALSAWMVVRWAVVVAWIAFALYAVVSILQHRPIIGPR